jgi:dTDP-3-amino-3,4,6-trideoxy-alpha-D-glucose transaminase
MLDCNIPHAKVPLMSMPDVLLNDFKRQWVDTADAVLAAVARVGESGWYILGKEVEQFEDSLARAMHRRHAIGCASGLDAIEIALRAFGIHTGTRILTTPLSAFATTLAIVRAGAVPVFVDVDEHGLIDIAECRNALIADPAIRAIVPVHLYGHAIDLAALEDLRDRFDVLVVEDCAQSLGAVSRGRPAGTVGKLAATSFYPTKNLGALGDGGAIVTDDGILAERCRALRDYGQTKKYVHDELGLNSRLDELHAAVLHRAFMPKLPEWSRRRRAVSRSYTERIHNPMVRLISPPAGSESAWHLFPVQVVSASRDAFAQHLQSRGVRTAIHYPRLIPRQKALADQAFEVRGTLARAAEIAATEVSLPIHPYLDDGEVDRVVEAVNSWSGA